MARRSALMLFLLLGACDPKPPGADGSTPEDDGGVGSTDARMAVGTGRDGWEPFEDGQTLELVAGCQGAQHVWTSVRAWGIDPRGTILDLSLTRDSDGMVMSQTFHVRVSLQPVAGTDYAEVAGLTLIVPEPDIAIGEALTMRASVTTNDGSITLTDERPIRIEWGPSACL